SVVSHVSSIAPAVSGAAKNVPTTSLTRRDSRGASVRMRGWKAGHGTVKHRYDAVTSMVFAKDRFITQRSVRKKELPWMEAAEGTVSVAGAARPRPETA